MKSEIIVNELDLEFDIYKRVDIWKRFSHLISPIENQLTSNWKKFFSGLMFDFAEEIDEIITTVFVSENLLRYLKENNKKNVLIFTHHPYWQNQFDYTWISVYPPYMDFLKENHISIYTCHIPLDTHPRYATDYYFAKRLIENIQGRLCVFDKLFNEYMSCGYYGKCKSDIDSVLEDTKPDYGRFVFENTKPEIIACSPGGGGILEYIKEAKRNGVDTYITGVCVHKGNNSVSRIVDFFSEIKKLKINIFELSHYSTESFVMKELPNDYFSRFKCKCTFFHEELI